jgi:hypothetical protein
MQNFIVTGKTGQGSPRWAIRAALVAYGVLQAVLYASLLPLWEGFDEPFHYAYVQELSDRHAFPRLGSAFLSAEVLASLQLAPASPSIKRNLPQVTTFGDYFRMPRSERERMQAGLKGLPTEYVVSTGPNYEAHQAPLAYIVLACADRAWSRLSLPDRVWRLRLVCGVFGSILTAVFVFALARRLHLPARWEGPLLFTLFSSQMFYATTARVSNDWLAVPLMAALFERVAAVMEVPSSGNAALLAVALVAGLLTKSYFLALVPFAAAVMFGLAWKKTLSWRAVAWFVGLTLGGAGPWYGRNLVLYRNWSGMQETYGGTHWRALAEAFTRLPWLSALNETAFASLWTGNNSFLRFSFVTLLMLAGGYAAAAALYAWRSFRQGLPPARELVVLSGCVMYSLSLMYVATVSFWFSHGVARTPGPWYMPSLMAVLLPVLFCGLARSAAAGRWIAAWLAVWSAYVIAATYWAKLIPLYAGYDEGRTTLFRLIPWYHRNFAAILAEPSATAMIAPKSVPALAAVVALSAIALAAVLCKRLFAANGDAA